MSCPVGRCPNRAPPHYFSFDRDKKCKFWSQKILGGPQLHFQRPGGWRARSVSFGFRSLSGGPKREIFSPRCAREWWILKERVKGYEKTPAAAREAARCSSTFTFKNPKKAFFGLFLPFVGVKKPKFFPAPRDKRVSFGSAGAVLSVFGDGECFCD